MKSSSMSSPVIDLIVVVFVFIYTLVSYGQTSFVFLHTCQNYVCFALILGYSGLILFFSLDSVKNWVNAVLLSFSCEYRD